MENNKKEENEKKVRITTFLCSFFLLLTVKTELNSFSSCRIEILTFFDEFGHTVLCEFVSFSPCLLAKNIDHDDRAGWASDLWPW